jgi:AraC-like DNA-binding protein
MDVLADILTITRLTGDVFHHSFCDPPWGLQIAGGNRVRVHVLCAGVGVFVPAKGRPIPLGPHDLVLVPTGTGHLLCDDPASPHITLEKWHERIRARRDSGPPTLNTGPRRRDRPRAELICATYTVAFADTHPVLRLLPSVIHIPGRDARSDIGLQTTLTLLLRELADRDIGVQRAVQRLLEVLFIHILRYWLDTQPEGSTGWLGALRDEPIGRALVELHTSPARDWTVRSLATAVGMSRPVLARRFTEKVGDTPLGYLRKLRLDLATRLLRETDQPLATIASSIGYQSEFAFNRAFHRAYGMPPGKYRQTPA